MKTLAACLSIVIAFSACNPRTEVTTKTDIRTTGGITSEPFGNMPDGKEVKAYTLVNKQGVEMKVINYGGIITSLSIPDRNNIFEDVALGYDSLEHYMKSNPYFGSLIGRYGNRIAKGKFLLDGKEYTLATNNDPNHLHGGVRGFDKVFWDIEEVKSDDGVAIRLRYSSPDGEEGYPGKLDVSVVYLLTHDNQLKIDYAATTDKKTIVNLTQHTYFNLTGDAKRDILGHDLQIMGSRFLPVDNTLIPTGELRNVTGTPFDFTKTTRIGSRINASDEQIRFGKGYDHSWVLDHPSDSLVTAAILYDSLSGREVTVLTTEPAIQFYSGNFLDGSNVGKDGVPYPFRYGLCLETQHYPDSPNKPAFPSVVLNPGETYRTRTVYKFSVR